MSAAKAFLVAFGSVSVGAFECSNTTLHVAAESGDVALDSKGNVWSTVTWSTHSSIDSRVWMCPKDGWGYPCQKMGGGVWDDSGAVDDLAIGIAVDDSGDFPVVYVTGIIAHEPTVKRCTWNHHADGLRYECYDYRSGWFSPSGLAVDKKGSIFIIDADTHGGYGVWKCPGSAACILINDSHTWPGTPNSVAVDSEGNVYVTGGSSAGDGPPDRYVKKCTSAGNCADLCDLPQGWGPSNAVAIGPDDSIYISDSSTAPSTLIQLSPDGICENVGAFDYHRVNNMVIDEDGVFYAAEGGDGGLRRICLSPSIKGIQI